MSYNLWKYFFEDDVESFRQYLARATYTYGAPRTTTTATTVVGSPSFKIGSPGAPSTSPRTPKQKRSPFVAHAAYLGRGAGPTLSRSAVNAKDHLGRTLLHHAASSKNDTAVEFVKALLEIPLLDLYIQDAENGWTALHRALYMGNIEIAQFLVVKDAQNVSDFAGNTAHAQFGGLFKIKDHEGNSPFEVFASTIAPRILPIGSGVITLDEGDDDSVNSIDVRDGVHDGGRSAHAFKPRVDIQGDEVFAFGSNKNLSLGLGDEDDRQFPERIHIRRPDHLLRRLYDDYLTEKQNQAVVEESVLNATSEVDVSDIPCVVRNQPIIVQDVVMSKMHTAVLTSDPISNLHVSGFGPSGRLGTGDELTRFDYVCICGGGLAKRKVSSVALGHYHTIAICSTGEVFTWGSNKYGQLGYALPEVSNKETPMQLIPRQLYGLVKKEQIIGTAASAIHSVIYSATAMYTFGKNEGQLGLVDADARSLEIQIIPRRVGTSILQAPIRSISVIDRATTILLENHDVIVFTQYAWKRVVFPLEEAPSMFFSQALKTRYHKEPNAICKVTSGGTTICALSTFGQVFTVEVPQATELIPSNVSTTNPNKARNALPHPFRVWSIGKPHMSAVDVAVGQDGSIILCTNSGSVWRKEKRAKIKSIHKKLSENGRAKDYKFTRVPNLTRAVAVRSNAFGAFAAVRKDCTVTRDQMMEEPPSLWQDVFPLLSFSEYGLDRLREDEFSAEPIPRFWMSSAKGPSPALIKETVFRAGNLKQDAEADFSLQADLSRPLSESGHDTWVTSTVTDVRLPVHSFMLKARSRVLRAALVEFEQSYFFTIPDIISIEYGQDGHIHIKLHGADFLTLANLVFYIYTDNVIDVWAPSQTSKALGLAPRYRQVRIESMKIAAALEMRHLERAARLMVDPVKSMAMDFETAYGDLDFWSQADLVVDLANGAETPAHSVLLCARCPFFQGLFNGRAGGMWTSSRRDTTEHSLEPTRVDLQHIEENIFLMVLRHMYADTGVELFDELATEDLDGFIDTVIEVASVANELMLDRLAQICQKVLGQYVTVRNVCGLLNTIAECSVTDFKNVALEYICLNLESMLELRLLDELEDYLLEELSGIVQENQLAYMPFARSGRFEAELLERHPQLAEDLERDRQVRIDSMRLSNRAVHEDDRPTPRRKIIPGDDDLPFSMDEDGGATSLHYGSEKASPSPRPLSSSRRASRLALGSSIERDETFGATSVDTEPPSMPTPSPHPVASPPAGLAMSNLELPKAAWKTSTSDAKIDFRQIMEQTTNSRVSNLTQAMSAASVVSSKTPVKMSQKERKKQQQELRRQESTTTPLEEKPSESQSPWTTVATIPLSKVTSPAPAVSPASPPAAQPTRPVPTRPTMTMRQTVAGSSGKSADALPTATRAPSSSSSTLQPAQAAPPLIQSIRHTPRPARSSSGIDAYSSMADILSQQQGEKLAIQEAAAKRSLQEIQQEQEFQEWWDQESRRVQEEEVRAVNTATRQSKAAGRGGRGARKRGSGRGGGTNAASEVKTKKTPSTPQAATRGQQSTTDVEGRSGHSSAPVAAIGPAAEHGTDPLKSRGGRGHGRRGRGKGRHEPGT